LSKEERGQVKMGAKKSGFQFEKNRAGRSGVVYQVNGYYPPAAPAVGKKGGQMPRWGTVKRNGLELQPSTPRTRLCFNARRNWGGGTDKRKSTERVHKIKMKLSEKNPKRRGGFS